MDKEYIKEVSELLATFVEETTLSYEAELGIAADIFAQIEETKNGPSLEEFRDYVEENGDGQAPSDVIIQLAALDVFERRISEVRALLLSQLK